ncbi:MAG TPA: acetate--CoA ligase family protein [Spirochaetota bacterium]|nr:acetate--CoA ligase family protein [Spirochaetota bacterium]HPI21933.1 acetate--CoA ligase family protein [Spirochaetota bacterium]HPU88837.1 acetate--CoA ligase family protein [Spirochaetota bacterium]
MHTIFYPESIVIIGLSSKPNNIPRMILENLLRWGYRGRIFGMNPRAEDAHVDGIKMYRAMEDLPEVPDLAVCLIPARFVPEMIEVCGKFGIPRMAIPSGGFAEFGEEGKKLADAALANARRYNIRFVGPNGVTVANTANGLCLPFVPLYRPPKGGLSVISQSGGVGLMMWNLLMEENIGMAKFASIGNKLDLDEVDFLRYFGDDPDTTIICLYLESVVRGRDMVEAAKTINKPIVVFKSNTTEIGKKAAMSHTAALSNDEDIIDSAFESAGIIRIRNYTDFVAVAKAFELPPMRGNRIMVMSPAGGFSVITADLCENAGFSFADPGEEFYSGLQQFANAGVIKFSNPLDMGDIYDPQLSAHVMYSVMHNEKVDGAVYVSQRPYMPSGTDVFSRMFLTDLSKETWGAILSSGKPLGICLFGLSRTLSQVKQNVNFPIFNTPEEMVRALAAQRDFVNRALSADVPEGPPPGADIAAADAWIAAHPGDRGEEALELLSAFGVRVAESGVAENADAAVELARRIGYPVVMKVVSPDALHKSDAGGVAVNVADDDSVRKNFSTIRDNLRTYNKNARFDGVRVQWMAGPGFDMFIGGKFDESFGQVVVFGYGGIYVEAFRDVATLLCPAAPDEIARRLSRLKSHRLLAGARGGARTDIEGLVDAVHRVSCLLAREPRIRELDVNPLRVLADGSGVMALDARLRIV